MQDLFIRKNISSKNYIEALKNYFVYFFQPLFFTAAKICEQHTSKYNNPKKKIIYNYIIFTEMSHIIKHEKHIIYKKENRNV